jgi:hypothetical protein
VRRYQQRHVRLSQVERLEQRLYLALLGVVPRTIEAEHIGGLVADAGDIDADGDTDIVAAPRWGPIYWYDNLGQGANFVRRVVATGRPAQFLKTPGYVVLASGRTMPSNSPPAADPVTSMQPFCQWRFPECAHRR